MRTTGINHMALVCRDMQETVKFYTEILDMPLIKTVALPDGGQHFFFDCGGGCALAFMEGVGVPGVPAVYDCGINRGLGVPSGTFHFALRCSSLEALEQRRRDLIAAGVGVGQLLDLDPYRSFFFDDPVNGLRLEYTTRLRTPSAADRDPDQRQFPASLALFEQASRPDPTGLS